ncbi:MAG: Type 1 glutamine amidotransferase-like domain-containing protein [Candidatus Paceibacterota bacterium]
MRLYLSSYKLGNQPNRLVQLFGKGARVAVIYNACDFSEDPIVRGKYLEVQLQMLRDVGFEPTEIDLREYFGGKNDLNGTLRKFHAIWVPGGNVFILRRAMKQSGFDQVIKELLSKDVLAYGGFSAGACVTTPTLKGIDIMDHPDVIPKGYESEIVWDGLNLVDYSIVPHFDSDHPEVELAGKAVEYFKKNNLPHHVLRDGEVILIDGSSSEFLN